MMNVDSIKIEATIHGNVPSYQVVVTLDNMPMRSLPMGIDEAVAMHWKLLTGKEMP